jgi:hypothetical protein
MEVQVLENMAVVFENSHENKPAPGTLELDELYAQIGQLKVENDFLKKSARRLGISDKEWK